MSTLMKHLPWIAPTAAVLVIGSGVLGRVNISFGDAEPQTAIQQTPALEAPAVQGTSVQASAVPAPATQPVAAPANVAEQLAVLLTETEENADVEVTRAPGFSIDVLETARDAALAETAPAVVPDVVPVAVAAAPAPTVDANFFASAQANLERDRRCIDDLRGLASQARVYFPSGGLTADQQGIEQARLLGILAQQCPGVTIQVSGHSDPSGNPVVNQRLSLERAQAVVTRVTASGIDSSLFVAVGRGSADPSGVTGAQPAAFYDRRVEFSVIETGVTQASFTAPAFGASGGVALAACVGDLQAGVERLNIQYVPRGVIVSEADRAAAVQLARLASTCPQARLRVIGQHSEDPRAGETSATGRLRAVVLMSELVGAGFPSEQIIIAAPSDARPIAGLSDSRVDFDVILEEF